MSNYCLNHNIGSVKSDIGHCCCKGIVVDKDSGQITTEVFHTEGELQVEYTVAGGVGFDARAANPEEGRALR
jgi:hypothetical protein